MPERPAPTMRTSKCSDGMVDSEAAATCEASSRTAHIVIRGLDPCIHHHLRKMDCRVKPGNDGNRPSIPVMIRLEGAFRLHADVVRLVLAQFGQLDADLGEM